MRQVAIRPLSEFYTDNEFSFLGLNVMFRCLLSKSGRYRTSTWRDRELKAIREARER